MAEENRATDAYRFDPEQEAATMKIQMNPNRYAKVNGTDLWVTKHVEKQADGKNREVYNFANAAMWVPPRVGDMLINHPEGSVDKAAGLAPMAKMLESRSTEEALAEFKKPAQRTRKAADTEVTIDEQLNHVCQAVGGAAQLTTLQLNKLPILRTQYPESWPCNGVIRD